MATCQATTMIIEGRHSFRGHGSLVPSTHSRTTFASPYSQISRHPTYLAEAIRSSRAQIPGCRLVYKGLQGRGMFNDQITVGLLCYQIWRDLEARGDPNSMWCWCITDSGVGFRCQSKYLGATCVLGCSTPPKQASSPVCRSYVNPFRHVR